jgi:ABC-2 type transport system permease protein
MNDLSSMIWVEIRKAVRSRMPLYTALGSLFMPLGIAFLIFVSRNPEISRKLGLISVKADLMAYSATDWHSYLGLFGMLMAAGGFFLCVLVISWLFGREFSDRTLKDWLAVPVPRFSILLAKFIVMVIWSILLMLLMLGVGIFMGAVIQLPGGSSEVIMQGISQVFITGCLVILVVLPFALFASLGRGYLLPIGMAVLILMMTNLVALTGWGEFFPWAVPGLYVQAKVSLPPVSYLLVLLTALIGICLTYWWWMTADQNR